MDNIPCPHWTCWERIVPNTTFPSNTTTMAPPTSTPSPIIHSDTALLLEIILPIVGLAIGMAGCIAIYFWRGRNAYVSIESNSEPDDSNNIELGNMNGNGNGNPFEEDNSTDPTDPTDPTSQPSASKYDKIVLKFSIFSFLTFEQWSLHDCDVRRLWRGNPKEAKEKRRENCRGS